MIQIRRSEDRGRTQLAWLDSRHTFSFGDYADPTHQGFRSLRVLNDDRVDPDSGFGMHSHRNSEGNDFTPAGQRGILVARRYNSIV